MRLFPDLSLADSRRDQASLPIKAYIKRLNMLIVGYPVLGHIHPSNACLPRRGILKPNL